MEKPNRSDPTRYLQDDFNENGSVNDSDTENRRIPFNLKNLTNHFKLMEPVYLQFVLRIVEDIINSKISSYGDVNHIIRKHMQANKGVLEEEKMINHINVLMSDLDLSDVGNQSSPTGEGSHSDEFIDLPTKIKRERNWNVMLNQKPDSVMNVEFLEESTGCSSPKVLSPSKKSSKKMYSDRSVNMHRKEAPAPVAGANLAKDLSSNTDFVPYLSNACSQDTNTPHNAYSRPPCDQDIHEQIGTGSYTVIDEDKLISICERIIQRVFVEMNNEPYKYMQSTDSIPTACTDRQCPCKDILERTNLMRANAKSSATSVEDETQIMIDGEDTTVFQTVNLGKCNEIFMRSTEGRNDVNTDRDAAIQITTYVKTKSACTMTDITPFYSLTHAELMSKAYLKDCAICTTDAATAEPSNNKPKTKLTFHPSDVTTYHHIDPPDHGSNMLPNEPGMNNVCDRTPRASITTDETSAQYSTAQSAASDDTTLKSKFCIHMANTDSLNQILEFKKSSYPSSTMSMINENIKEIRKLTKKTMSLNQQLLEYDSDDLKSEQQSTPTLRPGGPTTASRTGGLTPVSRTGGPTPPSRTGGPTPPSRTGGPTPPSRTGGPTPLSRTGGETRRSNITTQTMKQSTHKSDVKDLGDLEVLQCPTRKRSIRFDASISDIKPEHMRPPTHFVPNLNISSSVSMNTDTETSSHT